jgi:hypothetical protein
MNPIYEMSGMIEEDGKLVPFHVAIRGPFKTPGETDAFCTVTCPFFFKNEKKIFGSNKTQAKKLAREFVCRVIGSRKIVDKDGNRLDIS